MLPNLHQQHCLSLHPATNNKQYRMRCLQTSLLDFATNATNKQTSNQCGGSEFTKRERILQRRSLRCIRLLITDWILCAAVIIDAGVVCLCIWWIARVVLHVASVSCKFDRCARTFSLLTTFLAPPNSTNSETLRKCVRCIFVSLFSRTLTCLAENQRSKLCVRVMPH